MKKAISFFILFLAFSIPAFAGTNKASAVINNVVYDALNHAIAEYTVSYRDPSEIFVLDQQFVSVDLGANTSALNNAVQVDAQAKVNEEFGAGTISDKNDIRLVAGFVS